MVTWSAWTNWRRSWEGLDGFEVTGPYSERKDGERVMGWTPSSQPLGSFETTL